MSILVAKLVEITCAIEKLTEQKKEIEAQLLTDGADALKDTKMKSTDFSDETGNKVTYTEAATLTIISPQYLKQLFGAAYKDIITETVETKYKVSKKLYERMLTALYLNDYTRITVEDFWAQLPCSDEKKKALRRKIKGSDFAKDKEHLMEIGEFSESDAGDFAYMLADAVIWSALVAVCQLAGMEPTDGNLETIIHSINAAVAVDETSKLKLERVKNDET